LRCGQPARPNARHSAAPSSRKQAQAGTRVAWPAFPRPGRPPPGLAGLLRPGAPLADVRVEQRVALARPCWAAAHDGAARATQRRADGTAQVREYALLRALRPAHRVGHQPGGACVIVEPHLPRVRCESCVGCWGNPVETRHSRPGVGWLAQPPDARRVRTSLPSRPRSLPGAGAPRPGHAPHLQTLLVARGLAWCYGG
jgi:hypothetical protein